MLVTSSLALPIKQAFVLRSKKQARLLYADLAVGVRCGAHAWCGEQRVCCGGRVFLPLASTPPFLLTLRMPGFLSPNLVGAADARGPWLLSEARRIRIEPNAFAVCAYINFTTPR